MRKYLIPINAPVTIVYELSQATVNQFTKICFIVSIQQDNTQQIAWK